jgi:hypothetical protein
MRYHKIIIMTDADVDGSAHPHIAADLLLPSDAGADRARLSLYRAAALYKVKRGKSERQAGGMIKQIDAVNRTAGDRLVIEQAAIGGLFDTHIDDATRATELAKRLQQATGEEWSGSIENDHDVLMSRRVEGLIERRVLLNKTIQLPEARAVHTQAEALLQIL